MRALVVSRVNVRRGGKLLKSVCNGAFLTVSSPPSSSLDSVLCTISLYTSISLAPVLCALRFRVLCGVAIYHIVAGQTGFLDSPLAL